MQLGLLLLLFLLDIGLWRVVRIERRLTIVLYLSHLMLLSDHFLRAKVRVPRANRIGMLPRRVSLCSPLIKAPACVHLRCPLLRRRRREERRGAAVACATTTTTIVAQPKFLVKLTGVSTG